VFSDAHRLDAVGRARDGTERLTRIKMEVPSFEGFRTALLDPDARVVIEAPLPDIYPRIVGVRYVGGFLDAQEIAFAPNLTALIGGRGAGKSTAIEALRCACIDSEDSKISQSDAWPSTVQIEFIDAMGTRHFAQRDAATNATVEIIDGQAVPISIPLEGYQQDSVAEIVRGYDKDPSLLLAFFDQYLDDGGHDGGRELDRLRGELGANAASLLPLEDAPTELRSARSRLTAVESKIKRAEASKAHAALSFRLQLNAERELRATLRRRLDALKTAVSGIGTVVSLSGAAADAGVVDLSKTSAGASITDGDGSLRAVLEGLEADLAKWRTDGLAIVANARTELDPVLAAWDTRDKEIEAKIQALVEKLRAEGVPTDLRALNALAQEKAEAQKAVASQTKRVADRRTILAERTRLLSAYRREQARKFGLRVQLGRKLCDQFESAGVGFKVGIKFREGMIVKEYEERIRALIGNRFLRAERITQFCQMIHPVDLAADARTADTSRLLALRDERGNAFFSKLADAQEFLGLLREKWARVLDLVV
jgi:hypothetical protein